MDDHRVQELKWWAEEKVRGFMTGLHRSPDFGFSLEFAQHRAYVPGDAPKFIDWSVYARQDKVLTKQFEAESNLRAYLVLDSSSSMFVEVEGQSKWSYASRLLALITTLLHKQRDAIGLLEIRDEDFNFFEAKNTKSQIDRILTHIKGRGEQSNKNASIVEAIDELISRIPSRGQIIFIVDAFQEDLSAYEECLNKLDSINHQVLFLAIEDSRVANSKVYEGKEVVDAETGQRVFFNQEMGEHFHSFQKERLKALSEAVAIHGFKYFTIDCSEEIMVSLRKILA